MRNVVELLKFWIISGLTIGTVNCCFVNAAIADTKFSHWEFQHLKDGSSEFYIQHGNVKHTYRLSLTELKVADEIIPLTAPNTTYNQHYATKHWLPYLKETWFNTNEGWQWVIELNKPNKSSLQNYPINLSFRTEGDAHGSFFVDDSTRLIFDRDINGDPFRPIEDHNLNELGTVSIGTSISTRCEDVINVHPHPNNETTLSFSPEYTKFPVYLSNRFSPSDHFQNSKANPFKYHWYEAQISKKSDQFQLLLPFYSVSRGDTFDALYLQTANNLKQKISHEQWHNLETLIEHKGIWHPLRFNDLNRSVVNYKKQSIAEFKTRIKEALAGIEPLSQNIFMGKAITLIGNQMFVVSENTQHNIVHVFQFRKGHWESHQYIEIPKKETLEAGGEVYRNVLEPVITHELMVIPTELYGHPGRVNDKAKSKSLGVIHIYRKIRNRWHFEDSLTPDLGDHDDGFGTKVAIDNQEILVSAEEYNNQNFTQQLPGVVHVFEYKSGQWKNTQIIKPPETAQKYFYSNNQGFGSQLNLVNNDLYIMANSQGYVSINGISDSCPYFDSSGVIYHYQKLKGRWRLKNIIKPSEQPGHANLMIADESGLYMIATELNPDLKSHQYILYHYKNKLVTKMTEWAD